ncbi:M48 family metalloprotease [Vibrio sp. SS-MA-C1-2]|uniref:beta-barrel assembly-enhancing protease n=1 Tax=Vibrio sp. SS-MA-C1-2 TaxID=2908646 RepID=UPI001F258DFD|nr:M48 family metalloprotease [Vibrio sp. SS-MA-C1-2]UJF19782.1 M48 family metalloprotease [Vibrio sp. SS-MA-C1-2]
MFILKKITSYLLIGSLLTPSFAFSAPGDYNLPDIGTTASGTLSISKELEYGDAYMRMLRASSPLITDPVLSEYIQNLGHTLVANADGVKTPFHFFLLNNSQINAFAFFGGYIAIHSGLFLYTKDESELASVMAHEIAHITQRHLARHMEDQAKKNPATIAALVGSLMLAIVSPQAGIAALQTTTAASMQSQINYTRSNEKEADRIGIQTLARSHFDVEAMPTFFGRLADQYRFASKPPEMLLTHPLPASRLTDSRLRAGQYKRFIPALSEPFHLAQARIIARYSPYSQQAKFDWFNRRIKSSQSFSLTNSLNYGKALLYIDSRQYGKARDLLAPLIAKEPLNHFYLDSMTDLSLGEKKYDQAIKRLKHALKTQPDNSVIQLNLANALLDKGKAREAETILNRETHNNPQDINGWSLLAKSAAIQGNRAGELVARGEIFALRARWDDAINNYINASQLSPLGSLDQARYDARIDQLRQQRQRFLALK